MCFDMKMAKKIYFSGEIPVNDCRSVWRGLKSIRLIKKQITYLKSFMQRIIQKPILKDLVKRDKDQSFESLLPSSSINY